MSASLCALVYLTRICIRPHDVMDLCVCTMPTTYVICSRFFDYDFVSVPCTLCVFACT